MRGVRSQTMLEGGVVCTLWMSGDLTLKYHWMGIIKHGYKMERQIL